MPIDEKYLAPFAPREYYHVYNRCPSHKKMFIDPADYEYFLSLLIRYLIGSLDVYAYALIPNHFHLFVKIIESIEQQSNFDANGSVTNQFRITDEFHFSQVIYYVHANAVHYGISLKPNLAIKIFSGASL